jgi:next-to-BRCA1 protein 1
MASSQTSLDTMITLKVQYEGVTRRAKMPLRDMVPNVLENKVRAQNVGLSCRVT